MPTLSHLVESRIARLSHPLALEWPGGRAGDAGAQVRLKMRDTGLLQRLASGRIGSLADAYVRGDLEIDGQLCEVMAIAAELAGDPVKLGAALARHEALAARTLAVAAQPRARCGSGASPLRSL